MPPLSDLTRRQTAVLWPMASRDRQNEPVMEDPVELRVRWEHRLREVPGRDGTPLAVVATVWVDRRVPVGSAMWLGELADWPGTGRGDNDEELCYVATRQMVPDEKGREVEWVLTLTRSRDTLGTWEGA